MSRSLLGSRSSVIEAQQRKHEADMHPRLHFATLFCLWLTTRLLCGHESWRCSVTATKPRYGHPLHRAVSFQFPPHHFLILSPPHSSYSAFVTPTFPNSSVLANSAMPCHASIDGSEARMTPSGISGGRIGRNVAWRRGRRPGKADGDPVTNTFCVGEL